MQPEVAVEVREWLQRAGDDIIPQFGSHAGNGVSRWHSLAPATCVLNASPKATAMISDTWRPDVNPCCSIGPAIGSPHHVYVETRGTSDVSPLWEGLDAGEALRSEALTTIERS